MRLILFSICSEKCCNTSGFVFNRFKELKKELAAKDQHRKRREQLRRYRYSAASASNENSIRPLHANSLKRIVVNLPKEMAASANNDLGAGRMVVHVNSLPLWFAGWMDGCMVLKVNFPDFFLFLVWQGEEETDGIGGS